MDQIAGWMRLDTEADGAPLWKRQNEPIYIATRDMDQLRFLGAALTRFEWMSPEEFTAFIEAQSAIRTTPGRRTS